MEGRDIWDIMEEADNQRKLCKTLKELAGTC